MFAKLFPLVEKSSTDKSAINRREIAPEEWIGFFDSFRRQHEGWRARDGGHLTHPVRNPMKVVIC